MKKHFQTWKKTKILVILIISIILAFALFRVCFGKVFYVNKSISAPTGIYLKVPGHKFHKGDFVVVRSPDNYPEIKVKKTDLFLKQISGFSGEHYMVANHTLIKDGKGYNIYNLSYIKGLEDGYYIIPDKEVLLLNDSDISFDSRYFGPQPEDHIVSKVIPIISFKKIDNALISILPNDALLYMLGYIPNKS